MRLIFLTLIALVSLQIVRVSAEKTCHPSTERVQCGQLACKEGRCVPCAVDDDCYEESLYCDLSLGGKCRLKPWFSNLNTGTMTAIFLSIVASCIGIVAGVGGGGILVPMYTVLMSLPVSIAVGVSQLTIVGQSAFSFIFIVNSRHEDDPTRSLINYQYLSLLMPMAIAGTSIGAQVGKILPDIMRIFLLMLTFVALLRRLVAKAVGQFNAARATRISQALPTIPSSPVTPPKLPAKPQQELAVVELSEENDSEDSGDTLHDPKSSHTPILSVPHVPCSGPIAPLTEVVIIVASIVLLLAGAIVRKWFQCGSASYFCLVAAPLIALGGIFYFSYMRLRALGERDPSALYFRWNTETSLVFPLVAVGAGAAASMLGIGGGLILGFLFFEAGLVPLEASATSAVATLLVSGESIIQLSLQGSVHADYAVAFFSVGAFSGFFGQRIIMTTIKKLGWQYLIIAALTLIVALSMISLVSLAVYQAAVGFKEGGGSLVAWGKFCR